MRVVVWSRSNLNWTELSALNYSNRLPLVSYITKVSLIGRRNSKSIICQNIYIILLSQYFCVNLYRDGEFKMTPLPVQQDDLCDIIMYHDPNSEQHHKTRQTRYKITPTHKHKSNKRIMSTLLFQEVSCCHLEFPQM